MSDWLKNLKVGDKVFVRSNRGISLETVQKVTPTGKIVVNNTLYTNGSNRSNMWNFLSLVEATDEAVDKFTRSKFVNNVFRALRDKRSMTYTQAKQINEILRLEVQE